MTHKSIHQSKTCRILDSVALFSFYLHSAFLILLSLAPHIFPFITRSETELQTEFCLKCESSPD